MITSMAEAEESFAKFCVNSRPGVTSVMTQLRDVATVAMTAAGEDAACEELLALRTMQLAHMTMTSADRAYAAACYLAAGRPSSGVDRTDVPVP